MNSGVLTIVGSAALSADSAPHPPNNITTRENPNRSLLVVVPRMFVSFVPVIMTRVVVIRMIVISVLRCRDSRLIVPV